MIRKTIILGYDKGIPIVLAKVNKEHPETCSFYCEYCKKNHIHGNVNGHRVAHCWNTNSPFEDSGYILKIEAS